MKVFLPLYAIALIFLAPRLSLWLDEILTLIGAVEPNTSALLDYIKTVPGGSPLAFLAPRWSIQLLSYSVFAARLPSVIASVAACPAIYLLAQRMKIRTPRDRRLRSSGSTRTSCVSSISLVIKPLSSLPV